MERQHYIDWLRIFAILGVLFFHTAMLFVEDWTWHIQNEERSYLWLEFNFWLSRFRMPLLFFISGFGSYLALRKRTTRQYLGERYKRLMIPLFFAIFFIVPPQIYFERIFNGATFSFGEFYLTTFNFVPYPEGNMSWHHMWFVLYLFIYSAVGLPLFLWLRRPSITEELRRMALRAPRIVYTLTLVPTTLLFVLWTSKWPSTNALVNDWGYLPYWCTFFFAGYIVAVAPSLLDVLEKHARNLLGLAVLAIIIINVVRWNRIALESTALLTAYRALLAVDAWLWVLALVGLGKRYLNRPHRWLAYANQAIYPFYILHQTIIIVVGYYVIQVNEGMLAKYLFVAFVSGGLALAIYEYLIRPFRVMRFLFGVKSPRKASPKPAALTTKTAVP
ncbi:MAG TPA: acyltransferase, partial [Cytophagales bacterium]|nr:acyltransferase [Cytophagales bacterium]